MAINSITKDDEKDGNEEKLNRLVRRRVSPVSASVIQRLAEPDLPSSVTLYVGVNILTIEASWVVAGGQMTVLLPAE